MRLLLCLAALAVAFAAAAVHGNEVRNLESHAPSLGEDAGRRGSFLSTTGSFTLSSGSNTAGNDEALRLGEDHESPGASKVNAKRMKVIFDKNVAAGGVGAVVAEMRDKPDATLHGLCREKGTGSTILEFTSKSKTGWKKYSKLCVDGTKVDKVIFKKMKIPFLPDYPLASARDVCRMFDPMNTKGRGFSLKFMQYFAKTFEGVLTFEI